MKRYVIATTKSWNINNAKMLIQQYPEDDFLLITGKDELTDDMLESVQPDYVFFPHWSWIIKPEIYKNYNCVVFHMTDLPFGRGGSPLQNLIVRGIYNTKISAIKVCDGVDTGPIYFKEPIDISFGNADDILSRISDLVFEKMIPRFFEEKIEPVHQVGEVVTFKRRRPEQSEIPDGLSQRQLYDYIRMLDGEGYPAAYIDVGDKRIVFKNANCEDDIVNANVSIITR